MDRTLDTPPVTEAPSSAERSQRLFTVSMVVTAIRCIIAYVALPFLTPFIGLAPGVGPVLGITISVIAIGANLWSMRRFWVLDHRWKKPVTVLHVAVIILLLVLIGVDVADLLAA